MPINLGTEVTASLENQGGITTGTALGGDLTGTMPNPTVASVQGVAIPAVGYADGLGWRYLSGQMQLTSLLDEDSTFSGDVSGTQALGLTVGALEGVALEVTGVTTGQILKYNGTVWALASDAGGFTNVVATSAVTAADRNTILANTTAAAFTVTCPATPSAGSTFIIYDTHGQAGTNPITVAPATGDSLEGVVDDTLSINLNNAKIEMIYNGTTWKYYVPYVRP